MKTNRLRYKWCCWKAWFAGTFIRDAESGEQFKFKAWRTTGMQRVPHLGENFRVSKYVGCCVFKVPGLVVMRCYR